MEKELENKAKVSRISVRFADDLDARDFIKDFLMEDDNFNFTVKQEEDDIIRVEFDNTSANPADWVIENLRKDCKSSNIHGFDWKEVA